MERRIPIRLRRRGPLGANPVRPHRLDGNVRRKTVLEAARVDVLAAPTNRPLAKSARR